MNPILFDNIYLYLIYYFTPKISNLRGNNTYRLKWHRQIILVLNQKKMNHKQRMTIVKPRNLRIETIRPQYRQNIAKQYTNYLLKQKKRKEGTIFHNMWHRNNGKKKKGAHAGGSVVKPDKII